MSRILYIVIGTISLVLGVIGVIVPILPTTPFLLLTSICYTKGSKCFYNWFVATSIYQKHLSDFVIHRSMTLKTKIYILVSASIMLFFPLYFLDSRLARAVIIVLYITKYYYFIFKIKTIT